MLQFYLMYDIYIAVSLQQCHEIIEHKLFVFDVDDVIF